MSEQLKFRTDAGTELVIDFTDYDPPSFGIKSSLTLLAVWHRGGDIIGDIDADEIERQLLKILDAQTLDLREEADAANHFYRVAA